MKDKIFERISEFYSPDEYPALAAQMAKWRESRPFSGLTVLDATPVFTNTLVKYLPLLCGGAQLSVGVGKLTPFDPEVTERLRSWGIPVVSPEDGKSFDVISDCAGVFCHTASRFGYVELTRSGIYRYTGIDAPVFFADAGRIKFIETSLGTGEGYVRAMKNLGYFFPGKKVLVFGGGKVGRGVAMYSRLAGAEVAVVEFQKLRMPPGVKRIDGADRAAALSALSDADYVVSATGKDGALAGYAAEFCACRALIANMGVEDEFGPGVPVSRVLNEKRPLNFILPEPTCLKYIDPTMALANAGALELVLGKVKKGINEPGAALEEDILDTVRRDGIINEELKILEDL